MSQELTVVKSEPQLTKKDLDDWLLGSETKLTDKQKAMFYNVALAFQLNPIKREIYAIAYGNNFNIITGYETYLKRAERTGKLDYWEASVEKRDNEWIGICTVKRLDRSKPTIIEAWFNEYNQGNAIWKSKPRTMIRKVAIAQAFRMSFPDELGGMPYTSDEMGEVVPAQGIPKVSSEGLTNGAKEIVDPGASQKDEAQPRTSPGVKSLDARKDDAATKFGAIGYHVSDLEKAVDKVIAEWGEEDLTKLGKWYKEELGQIKAHEKDAEQDAAGGEEE